MSDNLISSLLTVLLSAFIAFIVQYFFKWREYSNSNKALESAILAEIRALYDLANDRKYLDALKYIIDSYENNPNFQATMSINFQESVCPVYSANLANIGLLPNNKVNLIVKFYASVFAIIQDFSKDCALSSGETASLEGFKNSYKILNEALITAEKVLDIKK